MPYGSLSDLNKYLAYNVNSDRLESIKPIQTTLNSFFLGDQHKISSGGENVFFTNITSDIDWYPMWGGIRDHEIVANRDGTGIVAPSARVYNPYQEVEFYGPAVAGAVDYAGATSSALESASIFGIEFILAESVNEVLTYSAFYGTDDTGSEVYKQQRMTTGVAGDIIEWWFEHPLEVHPPTDVFSMIKKPDEGTLQVRPGSVAPVHHYVKLKGRTFTDKNLEYISPYDLLTGMNFKQDLIGTHILFVDPNTSEVLSHYFINELKAVDSGAGGIRISMKDGLKVHINELDLASTFIDGVLVTQTLATAVNELNSLFNQAGTPTNSVPEITSALNIGLTSGNNLNYILTSNYGSEVIWDLSEVPGVVSREGNNWNLMGGTGLGPGIYNIPITLINSNGQDTETLVLTVSNPPYNNTRSVLFENNDYFSALATTSNPLYRPANGSGSSDAWTISMWVKGGTNNNSKQTLLSFGGSNGGNDGRVTVWWDNSPGNGNIRLRYGSDDQNVEVETPTASLQQSTWRHLVITYDGGTTGSVPASILDYYSRFGMWIDGVLQTLSGKEDDDGFSDEMPVELFFIGEDASGGNSLRDVFVDEIAIWPSDETGNVADIYNSGATHDLEIMPSPPMHYWRMGDGDTYPTIQDNIGSLDFTMINMTAFNIINDIP